MVKLVQTLEMLPTCDLATQPMIQFHYAFALNRYTEAGLKLGPRGELIHSVPKEAFTAKHLAPN